VHDDTAHVLARVRRTLRDHLVPATYRARTPLTLERWVAPGEPVPFAQAVAQQFTPVGPGDAWGRPWGTEWFHVMGAVPAHWPQAGTRVEVVVDLGFTGRQDGFECEGLVYGADGVVLKAVQPRNRAVRAPQSAGALVDLYVEAAGNPDVSGGWTFRPTPLGSLDTAGTAPLYRLGEVSLALLDEEVVELVADLAALEGLVQELPDSATRRARIVAALNRALDAVDPDDVAGTAAAGRAELADVLAAPASATAHQVFAVGHAHIDSAWLWPARETVRKVARTFANALDLMDSHPGFVFAASSAQQYQWLEQSQPELFGRLRARVAEGRFVPVGGMWVEADTNLPGGESLARQLVVGGRYFRERFGVDQPVGWLPDSFGYSAALPQLLRLAGVRYFLTQKLSWNETNRFPHHTFWWEGMDGTRVYTHFPPADTYEAELTAAELARSERQLADKQGSSVALVPFGYGDGGGGPTSQMLAAAVRTASLEGSPAVRLASPLEFFEAAADEYPDPPVWSGELYLELHRGTYTSQARTKQGNRRCEGLLREAELWATAAAVHHGVPYPYDELDRLWQLVLLGQFHDILPGSSIAWVHREAERWYAEVSASLERLITASLSSLVGPGDRLLAANAGPYAVAGTPGLSIAAIAPAPAPATVPSPPSPSPPSPSVTSEEVGPLPHTSSDAAGVVLVLENAHLRVSVDERGLLTSVVDLAAGREVLAPHRPGNLLEVFRDVPNRWDAWDIDAAYRRVGTALVDADEVTRDGDTVRVVRTYRSSRITQRLSLAPDEPRVLIETEVDWHEDHKLLKWSVPLDVHAERATSEIQFGHVHRPTHANTSWDAARFETVAHRWVHVGEVGYGVAVANDSVYGHDVSRTTRDDGGTTTLVRLSLLRAPRYPDPDADQGVHRFTFALVPGATIADAVAEGYRLNLPPRHLRGAHGVAPLVVLDHPAAVVEAVKLAEDRSDDVVVRVYEAHGSRARARLSFGFPVASVQEVDLHERPVEMPRVLRSSGDGEDESSASADDSRAEAGRGTRWGLELRPFQVVTLRVCRA